MLSQGEPRDSAINFDTYRIYSTCGYVVSDDVTITSSLHGDVIIIFYFLSKMSLQYGSCQKLRNCVYIVEVMRKKTVSSFFPDTVYCSGMTWYVCRHHHHHHHHHSSSSSSSSSSSYYYYWFWVIDIFQTTRTSRTRGWSSSALRELRKITACACSAYVVSQEVIYSRKAAAQKNVRSVRYSSVTKRFQ